MPFTGRNHAPRKSFCYEKTFGPSEPQDISSLPSSPTIKKAYRLIILGSSRTGKSCLVKRFLHEKFEDFYTPTIEDFYRKVYRIRGEFHQLDILDTSGNDPYPAARRLLLLTGDMFLLVFSVDNPESYEEAFRVQDQIIKLKSESHAPKTVSKVPIAFVATKVDIEPTKRLIDMDKAHKRINELQHYCLFRKCSSKTSEGVEEIFRTIFELGRLPKEMAPNYHQKLHETSSLGRLVSRSPLVRLKSKQRSEEIPRKDSEAKCATEELRRRSLRTELFRRMSKRTDHVLRRQPAVSQVPMENAIPEVSSGTESTRSSLREAKAEKELKQVEVINHNWAPKLEPPVKTYVPPPNPNAHLYVNPQIVDSNHRRVAQCKIF